MTISRAAGLAGALVLGSCASTPPARQAEAASTITLSIVGTNDVHGGILARDGRGGLALLGGYVRNLRAARQRDGGAVLLLDGGDMFQGTLESNLAEGAPVVAAYNALGYTAAAIGNHEFDFGPTGASATPLKPGDDPNGALKARASEARFPFLAANLIDRARNAPVNWPNVRPATLVETAGIRVGIIGVMTLRALTATVAANVTHLSVAPLADTIRTQATALRAKGADVVLVAAHAGGVCKEFDRPDDPSSCETNSEIFTVARQLPPGLVDAIVAGHTHAGIAHQIQGIPIAESYSTGRAFGRIDLLVDRASKKVVGKRSYPPMDLVPGVYEQAPVVPDAAVERVLAPTVEAVRVVKSRAIGVVVETPIRRLAPVSPLGQLFTDAMLAWAPDADLALNNSGGGLRADLPAGPLLYGGVFEVMPFDNVMVKVRLTGRQLRQVFANFIPRGRVLGFSGVRVKADCSAGSPAITMTRMSGAPVRDEDSLQVVVSNFVATGGDGILTPVMPEEGFPVDYSAPLMRDVFAEYLARYKEPLREDRFLERGREMAVSNCAR